MVNTQDYLQGCLRQLPPGTAGDREREAIRHELYDPDCDF